MKRILVTLGLALSLTGCNDIDGTLKVNETLNVLNKDGKSVTVDVGTYSAELKAKDKKTVQVKIEAQGKKSQKISFNVPEGIGQSERFDIPASQTGQPYGISGERFVDVEESPIQQGYEQCQTWDQICYPDPLGRMRCDNRTRWGQRYVEYRDITETQTVSLDLMNGSAVAASFNGSDSVTYRDYIRQDSFCR